MFESSSYTTTAFVVTGPFSDETRKNPATKHLELHCKEFFDTDHNNRGTFWTNTFSMRNPHGDYHDDTTYYADVIEPYYMRPFSTIRHEPYHQIAIENQTGWDLYACFYMYANITGDVHHNETDKYKATDSQGQDWDIRLPIYYHFVLVNDPKATYGLMMDHCTLIKDMSIVNAILDKRGYSHLKPYKPDSISSI